MLIIIFFWGIVSISLCVSLSNNGYVNIKKVWNLGMLFIV